MSRPTLTWTRTRPDRQFDFSAADGELRVGRVYRMMDGPADRYWQWHMYAHVGNRRETESGVAAKRAEAVRLVEERYREFRDR